MIAPENKLCPVPPVNVSRLCAGKLCAWFLEDEKRCAIVALAEGKTPAPKKKTNPKPMAS